MQASKEVDAKQEEADNIGAALPVQHLLLCVHGIGQNLTSANIAGKECRVLRVMVTPFTSAVKPARILEAIDRYISCFHGVSIKS